MTVLDLPVIADPDDVLSQPTRARLFALLSELKRPAGTVELAERLELHPNGVRLHLERLAQEGLIERARVRQRRGRPPDAWTIAPQARPGGRPPHAYKDLGRWLARALGARPGGLRGVESTGRQIGRELALKDPYRDPDALETTLTALGFQPTIERGEGGQATVCLGNCPYREAVRENQPAICALHKGDHPWAVGCARTSGQAHRVCGPRPRPGRLSDRAARAASVGSRPEVTGRPRKPVNRHDPTVT